MQTIWPHRLKSSAQLKFPKKLLCMKTNTWRSEDNDWLLVLEYACLQGQLANSCCRCLHRHICVCSQSSSTVYTATMLSGPYLQFLGEREHIITALHNFMSSYLIPLSNFWLFTITLCPCLAIYSLKFVFYYNCQTHYNVIIK